MARRARNGPAAAEPEDDQLSGPRALRASLLPRGTKRRRAARVGIQVARDARTYGQTLRQLWAVAEDKPDASPYQTWLRAHRATEVELATQRQRVRTAPPGQFRVVIDASTSCTTTDIMEPGSFSWHVLSSLTDDLRTFHNGHSEGGQSEGPGGPDGRVFGITLTTRRAGSSQ